MSKEFKQVSEKNSLHTQHKSAVFFPEKPDRELVEESTLLDLPK